jgi:hypothetical protein
MASICLLPVNPPGNCFWQRTNSMSLQSLCKFGKRLFQDNFLFKKLSQGHCSLCSTAAVGHSANKCPCSPTFFPSPPSVGVRGHRWLAETISTQDEHQSVFINETSVEGARNSATKPAREWRGGSKWTASRHVGSVDKRSASWREGHQVDIVSIAMEEWWLIFDACTRIIH